MATKKFSDLRAKMSPAARSEIRSRADRLLRDMALADLRRAQELTQQQLAKSLNVNQAWISKIERQADMYLSTLRAYVKGLGGELELLAHFGDGTTVRINDLGDLGNTPPARQLMEAAVANAVSEQMLEVYASPHAQHRERINVWYGEQGSITTSSRTPTKKTDSATSKAA